MNLYVLDWLERMKRHVKANTWKADYRSAINYHIVPYFGGRSITELRPVDIRAFLDHLADKGLAEKTVTNIRGVLSGIFRSALEEEIVERNPVSLVRMRPSHRSRKKQFNTLTLDELHRLLETIQTYLPEWYAFLAVLAYTGLRLSEIRGLRWGSAQLGQGTDDSKRYITVRETVTGPSLVDDVTKTGKERRVDLNTEARQALLDHHVEELAKGKGRASDYVFCRSSGAPLRTGHANEILTKACVLAGLKRITSGDLRHTYITVMLYELEEDLLYVIDQVGHSSVQMILQHYGHPERYHRPEKVDRMAPRPAIDRPSSAIPPVSPWEIRRIMVGDTGFEPVTSRV